MACEFSRRGGVVKLQKKTVSASTTGKVNVLPDPGYTALSGVDVNQIQLQSKSILPGSLPYTFSPDANYDGLGSAVVQKDPNLISDNIIAGKSIYGVSGHAQIGGRLYLKGNNTIKSKTIIMYAYTDSNYTIPARISTTARLLGVFITRPLGSQLASDCFSSCDGSGRWGANTNPAISFIAVHIGETMQSVEFPFQLDMGISYSNAVLVEYTGAGDYYFYLDYTGGIGIFY